MKTFKKALSVLTVVFMLFCLSSLAFAAPSENESTTAKAETEATTEAPETSNEQEKETGEETSIPEDTDAYKDNYNDTYGGFDIGSAGDNEYNFDSENYGEKEFENFLKENTAVLVFFIIAIILWSVFPIILIVMIVFIVLYCSAKNDLKRYKKNAGFNQYNQYNPPYGNGNYTGNGGWQR